MKKKCSVCGKKADIVVNIYLEGFTKEIAYCRECLKESVKRWGKDELRLNLDAWSIMNSKPKLNIALELVEVDGVSILNESAKKMLGSGLREEEKVKYEISQLRRKMAKAIKNENYELAGILQREIKRLKSIFKKAK